MSLEEITERLKTAMDGAVYCGNLTAFAAKSIESGRSSYPVANLMTYCKDSGLTLCMMDMATEDCFFPRDLLDVHHTLSVLMDRYNVDKNLVYRKTGIHYTVPNLSEIADGKKTAAPLSIKTLIAVCQVIHCDLIFKN